MKHKSDRKHASVARARAKDKENEARKYVKVVEDELWLAREELQTVKGDLWAKSVALERACQEALEAGKSVERLTEELGRLRMDLERQEVLVSRRGEVIVELRDEACTQLISMWLAFQRRASRAFPDLKFHIHLSNEEVEEFAFEAEVNGAAEVLSGPPYRAPLLGDLRILPKANFSASPVGVPPFDSSTFTSRGRTSGA